MALNSIIKGFTQSQETVKAMNEGTSERASDASHPPSSRAGTSLETEPLPESWSQLIIDLCPQALDNPKVMRREEKACNQLLDLNWEPETVREFWAWNMKHKSGKWRFTSLATLLKSVTSDSEKSGYSMFLSCQSSPCRICKPKESSAKEKVEHSHGCYNNPCYCYLSLGPENQEYWRTLVKYNLCGNVRDKWYLGKSAAEAIAGYPDIAACIQDLFHKQPPDLIAKLSVLIQESTARKPQTEVKADEYVRYMSGLDEPERAAFEIEEDLG